MYIPVVAPRYPADEYHPANGTYEADYFYNGEAYLAKRFWSITDYVFAGGSQIARVVISLTQAMLVIRAWLIVSGQADRKKEIAASVVTLGVVGFFLVKMMLSMWSCRWAVLAVMALWLGMSIVMSGYVEHTAPKTPGQKAAKTDNGQAG
jgi:predicted phage tail protein